MKDRLRVILALLLVASLPACQTKKKDANASAEAGAAAESGAPADEATGESAIVSTDSAAFYRYGPAQAQGADLRMSKGTLVTVLKKGKAYSSVRLQTGMAGFMITRDLMFGDEAAQVAAQLAAQGSGAPLPPPVSDGGDPKPKAKYKSTARVIDPDAPQATESNAPETPLPDSSDSPATEIEPITPSSEDVKFPAFRY
jgi:hypothetical protein